MEKDMVEMVFLIDKSISMYGREEVLLNNLNQRLRQKKFRQMKGYVTLGIFSDALDLLYVHNELTCVKPLTRMTYFVEGDTAFFDAVREIFERVETSLDYIKDEIDKHVEVCIITDGWDNASVYQGVSECVQLLNEKQKKGWQIQIVTPENEPVLVEGMG